jgi:hypothetical protein
VADGDNNGLTIVDLGAVEDGLVLLRAAPQTYGDILQNGFEISLTGETNRNYVIEYSIDLFNWNPISTNLVPSQGITTLFDSTANNPPGPRFYRAFAVP